jgi:ABC-type dipeptide/oligopeptide/nickel transport system ATPase component
MCLMLALARETGRAVLFTERDTNGVFRTGHRVPVMDKGSVIVEGSSSAIWSNPTVKAAYPGIRTSETRRLQRPGPPPAVPSLLSEAGINPSS